MVSDRRRLMGKVCPTMLPGSLHALSTPSNTPKQASLHYTSWTAAPDRGGLVWCPCRADQMELITTCTLAKASPGLMAGSSATSAGCAAAPELAGQVMQPVLEYTHP